VRGKNF